MPTPSVVLVVGGSGYLGQFLVSKLAHSEGLELAFTHCSSDPPQFDAPTTAFKARPSSP
jgi:NAD(P)-dependent dehydrogenase (short-subunit alcohol dehydrogenase family)